MKTLIFTVLQLVFLSTLTAQCYDVYDNKTACPTMEDSLLLYKNAVKVIMFYETNPNYVKTGSKDISTAYDKIDIFKQLADARRLFKVIRNEFPNTNKKYRDITFKEYYHIVDNYRFYQRELENQMINSAAQISLYDFRISPLMVNFYKNINSNDSCYGDLVNIPLYAPVVVKPFMLLTDSELILRNSLLHIPYTPLKIVPVVEKQKPIEKQKPVEKSKDIIKGAVLVDDRKYKLKYNIYCPVYYFEDPKLGGPALIGFMNGRTFVRIHKEDYKAYAVPKWAQEMLQDDKKLIEFLRVLYGKYCLGFI